jgi:hypothetical protein
MNKFNAVKIGQTNQTVICHENCCPMAMDIEQAKEMGAIWQVGKQWSIVSFQPATEGSITNPFSGQTKSLVLLLH